MVATSVAFDLMVAGGLVALLLLPGVFGSPVVHLYRSNKQVSTYCKFMMTDPDVRVWRENAVWVTIEHGLGTTAHIWYTDTMSAFAARGNICTDKSEVIFTWDDAQPHTLTAWRFRRLIDKKLKEKTK